MTVHYKAEKNGKTVWEGTSKEYDRETIPAEWRGRPESGTVKLFVDGELIGVQKPIDPEEEAEIVARRAEDAAREDSQ